MQNVASLLLLMAIMSSAHAQQPPSKDQHEVQQTVISLFNALSARDSASLKYHCTTDVRFYEYGEVWPVDTLIVRAITKNTATDFKRTNKLDFLSTTIEGEVALATYYLQSDITNNGKQILINWMETVILMRDRKKWKVKVLHSTRLNKK